MKACELKVEPTAFECPICCYGDAQVHGEPTVFEDLLLFQEENNSVIFGDMNGGSQYIVEICSNGHVLCTTCTTTVRRQRRSACPMCRRPCIQLGSARTLPVFVPTPADELVITQQNLKLNFSAQHTVLVALHAPTAQEKQADDEVQLQLQGNALLPPLLHGQPLASALQQEDDLLHNYLNNADPTRSYFQLLLSQMPPIHQNTAGMDATNALLNVLPIPTQHMQDVSHSQMRLDLCKKQLIRLQSARPHPSYVDRLLERDPQWRERTLRNHRLPAPQY